MNLIANIISLFRKTFIILKHNKRIKIGSNVYFEEKVVVKIDKGAFISIDDNSYICKGVELRAKNFSKILIGQNVKLDNNVRLVSANEATINLEKNVKLGMSTIFNAGSDIKVGEFAIFASNCSVNSSSHVFNNKEQTIQDKYKHKPVNIEKNVWVGASCVINPGITIGENSVLSANLNVNQNVLKNKILKLNATKDQVDIIFKNE